MIFKMKLRLHFRICDLKAIGGDNPIFCVVWFDTAMPTAPFNVVHDGHRCSVSDSHLVVMNCSGWNRFHACFFAKKIKRVLVNHDNELKRQMCFVPASRPTPLNKTISSGDVKCVIRKHWRTINSDRATKLALRNQEFHTRHQEFSKDCQTFY